MTPADLLKLAAPRRGSMEWQGHAIHFREITYGEQQRFAASKGDPEAASKTLHALVVSCLAHEDGTPVFPENPDPAMTVLSAAFVSAVFEQISRLSAPEADEKKA